MNKFSQKLLAYIGITPVQQPAPSPAAARRRLQKRRYDGARLDRLTNDWVSTGTSANQDIRQGLRILRARSRDLAHNSDYVKKFLSLVRENVVGPGGIRLQAAIKDASEMDSPMAKIIEDAWAEWSHAENASVTGKLSWLDQQRMFIRHMARDGEVLIHLIAADNPFGFALKFIDPSWLDETYNATVEGGNRILMSVEIDRNDRPVAYHLTPPHYDYLYPEYGNYGQRQRVPASEIIHKFLAEDDEIQVRGVPWIHSATGSLKMLDAYVEAEVVAARLEASKFGMVIPPAEDEMAGDVDEDNRQPYLDDVEPGQMRELPPGYTFETFDPKHPNAQQGPFMKSMLRKISSGIGVSYVSLANDLEGVNYSSIRAGLLEERDVWRALQAFTIEHFCRPVFQGWLRSAMLTGAIPVRIADFDRVKEPNWRARGWTWVDPVKDVQATVIAINNGLDSRTAALQEQGEDYAVILQQLADEQSMAEAAGVDLQAGQPTKPSVNQEENEPEDAPAGAKN